MKLLNVRLDPDDARRAAELQRAGVQLSKIIRHAIRTEHTRRLFRLQGRRRASAVMAEIYASYPDPPGLPPRDYDVHDSVRARQVIVRRLRRKRS